MISCKYDWCDFLSLFIIFVLFYRSNFFCLFRLNLLSGIFYLISKLNNIGKTEKAEKRSTKKILSALYLLRKCSIRQVISLFVKQTNPMVLCLSQKVGEKILHQSLLSKAVKQFDLEK